MSSGQKGVNIGCAKPNDAANAIATGGLPTSSTENPSVSQPPQAIHQSSTFAPATAVAKEAQGGSNQQTASSAAPSPTDDSNLVLSFPNNLPTSAPAPAPTSAQEQASAVEINSAAPVANQKDSIPPASLRIPQVSAAPTPEAGRQIAANHVAASTPISPTPAIGADAAGITIVPEAATTGANGLVTVTVTVTTTVHDR